MVLEIDKKRENILLPFTLGVYLIERGSFLNTDTNPVSHADRVELIEIISVILLSQKKLNHVDVNKIFTQPFASRYIHDPTSLYMFLVYVTHMFELI